MTFPTRTRKIQRVRSTEALQVCIFVFINALDDFVLLYLERILAANRPSMGGSGYGGTDSMGGGGSDYAAYGGAYGQTTSNYGAGNSYGA